MSLGNLLSSLAPVAAGFMTGGSSLAFAPLLAGAATGAGIAALRDEDPLMGAVTGGLGGYGGGELGKAAAGVGAGAGAGAGSAIPARTTTLPSGMVDQGLGGITKAGQTTVNMPAIGTAPPTYSATTAAKNLFTNPGGVISNLGGGDISKGALKAGAIGLPAVAGAMVDTTTAEQNTSKYGYDPNRRLNLNMNTGLRLLNEGGYLDRPPTPEEVEAFRKFEQERQLRESMGLPDIMSPERMEAFRKFEQDRQLEESMRNYQEGGYLDEGAGDGMSDEIMGDIDGTQPVRLSEGEFVVPADVVSHLGNGDSDSGAEQLYAMMDRVRQARTGTAKQGKEIEPEELMPA